MKYIGSYEAKTHLAEILEEVARGETYTITKHKNPVAILKPVSSAKKQKAAEVIQNLKKLRKGKTIGSSQELKESGRR